MDLFYEYTEDDLMLQGTYFNSGDKEICILFVHGQAQSIIDNHFAYIIGKKLSNNNISFLYGHNRGYSYINCMTRKDGTIKKLGSTFEIFEDCVKDISVWVKKIKELGYKKIVLMGHSLGCNKALYYLSQNVKLIDGVIFLSPPDMVGITKIEEENFERIMEEARENIKNNESNKILNNLVCNFDYVSSKTFVNFYTENNAIDNFPIERNPKVFEQLAKVSIPILSMAGSLECKTYLEQKLLKEKAINCKHYNYYIIEGSNHFYNGFEDVVLEYIINFVRNKIKS